METDDFDDIEDVAANASLSVDSDRVSVDKALVFPKKRIQDVDSELESKEAKNVPGTQKIWLKTYGCSHNVSDSEYMEGILSSYGFSITEKQEDADLWLLNSCTVKDPSQAAFMHMVNKAKDSNTPVVVAGCVSQADRSIPGLDDVSIIGISQIDRVVEVTEIIFGISFRQTQFQHIHYI